MIMRLFPAQAWLMSVIIICLFSFTIPPGIAADIDMEGYLGETITLRGYSYVGDSVYLFLTGPGLPENGVTLTNTGLRADQGQFTVVPLDDNQEWMYIWRTSRISNEIDPGTYIVYVTNRPLDKEHLGGTGSFKTIRIFLRDSGVSKVSIEAGKASTLNPEEYIPTLLPLPVPSPNITRNLTVITSPVPSTTAPPASVQTTVTPRSGFSPVGAMAALACCAGLVMFLKSRK